MPSVAVLGTSTNQLGQHCVGGLKLSKANTHGWFQESHNSGHMEID